MPILDAFTHLRRANVLEKPTPLWREKSQKVYLSHAGQLLGTYNALCFFRREHPEHYMKSATRASWEAHHIFEDRELDYLGVRKSFPPREYALCVLIPRPAHQRINSLLSGYARRFKDPEAVREGYRLAHMTIGNYCGGGSIAIQRELDAIIFTAFRHAGLIA